MTRDAGNPLRTRAERSRRLGEVLPFLIGAVLVLLLATPLPAVGVVGAAVLLLALGATWVGLAPPAS